MSNHPIPEELVLLLNAIADDKELCQSLLSLQQSPPIVRETVLRNMADQMRTDGVNTALVDAISALTQQDLYNAACSAIRDLYWQSTDEPSWNS